MSSCNIYGGPLCTAGEFYKEIGTIIVGYENGILTRPEAANNIWSWCGEYSETIGLATLRYANMIEECLPMDTTYAALISRLHADGITYIFLIKELRAAYDLPLKEAKVAVDNWYKATGYTHNLRKEDK